MQSLRDAVAPLWDRVDALVVPTVPTSFTLREVEAEPIARNADLGRYCQFVNLLGLAAVAVPSMAAPSGQPFGVTVVGPPSHEAHLVAVAAALEAALRGTPKDGVSRP